MNFKMLINDRGALYDVTNLCEGDIRLTSERRGSPAKLEFAVMRIEGLSFFEGNQVSLTVKDTPMFLGYVFKKSRDKEQIISVTAYDQLQYLKIKDTYVYEKKKASELISMIANDHKRELGSITDTGYVIPSRCEDSQTLMDIIYNALDLTVINTGRVFVLYDDFGGLTLKSIQDMRLDEIVSARYKMINYNYSTDIETDTYNQIKLIKDNKKSGKREVYVEKDSGNIQKWGLLQRYEKVDEDMTEGQIIQLAQQLLQNHNRVKRTLSVENLEGDLRIRGGSSLMVEIPAVGEINLNKLLVVRKCVHTFRNNEHSMKLDLEGLG